jgi:hypothetical protein|tara:strand:- start:1145 stop:1369 length:225 start_codon:yes stop_codon:yes gene_type:complete
VLLVATSWLVHQAALVLLEVRTFSQHLAAQPGLAQMVLPLFLLFVLAAVGLAIPRQLEETLVQEVGWDIKTTSL